MRIHFLCLVSIFLSLGLRPGMASEKPNVLLILADDLGYGDVSCYNEQSKVQTPHLDRLAKEGIQFLDAHTPSTVCTPSRYGLLTGRMPFRLNYRGVFTGAGGPCLIDDKRLTIAEMFKEHGYTTAMYGKWHVGMTFFDKDGKAINRNGLDSVKRIDYSRKIKGTPIEHGFDLFFGTACCPTTDWLYAYIDQDRIPVAPKGLLDRTHLPKHPYSRDNRKGMHAEDFDLQEVDDLFLEKSLNFLADHKKKNPKKPFFLFHSTQAVHLPSFAGKKYRGKTKAGPHGDFIHQLDVHVGELMKALKKHGYDENTLVLFSSDNGPEVPTVINMRKTHQHDGSRPWRGVKRDNWEGGHRVPFIARWPKAIPSGLQSNQTVCLTDIMATCADILNFNLPKDAAEDSFSLLPILKEGDKNKINRPYTIHQTWTLKMAIRQGDWKYIDHKGSGGSNYERAGEWGLKQYALPDTAPNAPGQLYNLAKDPGETNNLYEKYPEIVKKLKGILEANKLAGRTR